MESKSDIRVVLISSAAAVVVGLMSALVTGMFLIKSNTIMAEKDIKVINAQNTQKNLEIIKTKAENYIDSVMDLVIYLQIHDTFEVNRANELALRAQKNGFKLMVHVGPQLAKNSVDLSLKLQASIDVNDSRPLGVKINEVTMSAAEWYKAYFVEIYTYNYQSMPHKMEADSIALIIQKFGKS